MRLNTFHGLKVLHRLRLQSHECLPEGAELRRFAEATRLLPSQRRLNESDERRDCPVGLLAHGALSGSV